jgi:CNT family concentrative nucleoside transporter
VLGAFVLTALLGACVFWLPLSRRVLVSINDTALAILGAAGEGAEFLFGPLAVGPGQQTAAGEASIGFVLATQALPAVVFFAAAMALLYHLGVIQPLVRLFARLFRRTLALSGAEALAGAANVFVGVESVAAIRPYVERMTRSELLTLLTCCMATVASTTLALYVLFLGESFPQITGHLVSASVLSIPAAVAMSKVMLPETETPLTWGALPPDATERRSEHAMGALSAGAWDGLRLAAGIAVLLIAVLGLVGLLDRVLVALSTPFAESLGGPLGLGRILGWLFTPIAWLLGIEGADLAESGRLLGTRLVLTEVVAYRELGVLAAEGGVSPRTLVVLSYALCGFAHFASTGIFVGGIAALAPSRRDDLAALAPRALAAATLATLATGALAGVFYHGQEGLLGL